MQSTGQRVVQSYRDGGPLWELTMSGVQPRQLVPIDIMSGTFKQFFRIIWAEPSAAKEAATKWMEAHYGAEKITFWRAPNSLPQDFYAEFTMNRRK